MPTTFFTGYPGFLGSALLPRVLGRDDDLVAVCLVQPRFLPLAQGRVAELERAEPALRGRIRLVEGDISVPGIGVDGVGDLQREIVEIWHLAAVYDLSVRRDLAMRVNVDGTRHLLDFAGGCPELGRFQYVSTCYVSGRYTGIYRETDLAKGQRFNNHYEESKYLAEVLVQERMADGLPASIYRPAVVVGDSATGVTQKYDGPYFVMRWLLRSPRVTVLPTIGDPTAFRFNAVPRDFVVSAIEYLSGRKEAEGKVYALADPAPLTVAELIDVMAEATGRRVVTIPAPMRLAKAAIEHVPGVYPLLGIPSEGVDYFSHPTHYDTTQASADLAGSGITCPPFPSYVDALVRFVRAHPEISSAAMV